MQCVLLVRKKVVWEITRGADLPTLSGGDDITVIIMVGINIIITITITIIIAMLTKTCRYISDKQTQISGGHPSSEAAQDTFLHQVVGVVAMMMVLGVVALVRWWMCWECYP